MDYVKISRRILEWEWYTDVNTKVLFLHILLRANWKPGRFHGVDIPRGSFATSLQNLATETGLTIRGVRTALKHLEKTEEVTQERHAKFSVITVKNYDKYQTGDTQVTQERHRSDTGVTTIEERKKGRKKEYIESPKGDYEGKTPSGSGNSSIYTTIRDLYNSVCGSYPRLVKMSDTRKKAINARLKTGYTIDDFQTLFEKAEASEFLKGANPRNWSATFDWLISDSNMAKVLDGNYDQKREPGKNTGGKVVNRFNHFPQRDYDFDALERSLNE